MALALSNGGSQWILYVEQMAAAPLELTLQLPVSNLVAEWMDVVTGKVLSTTTITKGKLSVPVGANDKVAIIRSAAGKK